MNWFWLFAACICFLSVNAEDKPKGVILYTYHPKHYYVILKSLEKLDENFNCQFKYPIMLLWDHLHPHEMQTLLPLVTKSKCTDITLVNVDKYFELPSNVDKVKMNKHITHVLPMGESYRHMCRFWSGAFLDIPELQKYDWYWRMDSDSLLMSKVEYDPFLLLQNRGAQYATRLVMGDAAIAVEGLKAAVDSFMPDRPKSAADDLAIYYTNFEISSLKWMRSQEYRRFFQHLDKLAGFHHLRWGDAPVHTYAADILLPKGSVVFLTDFVYQHGSQEWGLDLAGAGTMWRFTCKQALRHRHPLCDHDEL